MHSVDVGPEGKRVIGRRCPCWPSAGPGLRALGRAWVDARLRSPCPRAELVNRCASVGIQDPRVARALARPPVVGSAGRPAGLPILRPNRRAVCPGLRRKRLTPRAGPVAVDRLISRLRRLAVERVPRPRRPRLVHELHRLLTGGRRHERLRSGLHFCGVLVVHLGEEAAVVGVGVVGGGLRLELGEALAEHLSVLFGAEVLGHAGLGLAATPKPPSGRHGPADVLATTS
mmetsp:Transcript_64106/g.171589  ORF Transcript_64106/g.171589 Transcript_64106/m.171589 type:complete len:230 (-) Transcript_64106:7-696(-)